MIKTLHLGDVLLASPVLSTLRNALPEALIDACLYADTADLLRYHPAIHAIHLVQRGHLIHDMALFWRIYRNHYDLVIHLGAQDRGAFLTLASLAKIRVGFCGLRRWHPICYTHTAHKTARRHQVEVNLDALRSLGIQPTLDLRRLSWALPESAYETLHAKYPNLAMERAIVLHGVSRWMFKSLPWPLAKAVVRKLQSEGWLVLLTGANNPKELLWTEEVARECVGLLNLAGKLSLLELGALLTQVKAVVSVDTATMHMACALSVPLVAVFGPSSSEIWGPWMHSNARVVRKGLSCQPCHKDGCGQSKISDCLWQLTPEEILSPLREVVGSF